MVENKIHGATLPKGWTAEASKDGRLLEIHRVSEFARFPGGYVTIDMTTKIFGGGMGQPHGHAMTAQKKDYTGRGWKKQIVQDACKWLENEMTK